VNDADTSDSAVDSGDGTEVLDAPSPPLPLEERIVFALRQAAILSVCLIVGGLLVDRLRPEEAAIRDIFTAPFLWAAALWVLVLLFHAIAFEQPVTRRLEREPLFIAGAIGLVIFVIGVIQFTTGPTGRRIIYLATNAIGSVLFWWAITSLVMLLMLAVRPASDR
jgi:hypothetical protein